MYSSLLLKFESNYQLELQEDALIKLNDLK